MYWAVEKGSYSAINEWSIWDTPKPVRCIRILPGEGNNQDISSISGVQSDATYEKHTDTSGSVVLEFKGRLVDALYRERTNGSLEEHDEDDPANSFYDGIIVAKEYIGYHKEQQLIGYDRLGNPQYEERDIYDEYPLGNIIGHSGTKHINQYTGDFYWTYEDIEMENPCANYTEGNYSWRVPNLVELSAMNADGLLVDGTGCCTSFSNIDVRHGFHFSSWISCPGPGDDGLNTKVKIRCVRDVPEGYIFPNN